MTAHADRRLSRRTVERYADLLQDRGERVAVENDTVFYNYNRMVEPMAPAGHQSDLSEDQARRLVSELGGVLVRWGEGFREHDTGWYCIACDDLPALESNPSKNARSKIRRGLKNCRVEQIDADYMARHAYPVYASAFERYGARQHVETEGEFVRKMSRAGSYPDLVHYWGVFVGSDLVGYAANYVYDEIEVNLTEVKFDPAYLKQYASYALVQEMTAHYLDAGIALVNAGGRSLTHDTAFQNYLTSTFQYRKAFVRLRVVFRPRYGRVLAATRPLRGLLGRVDRRAAGLYELHAIGRAD